MEASDTDFGIYTALFKMDNQQDPTVWRGNSAQRHVAAWIGGEFVGERIDVYVCLSSFAAHLKLAQQF